MRVPAENCAGLDAKTHKMCLVFSVIDLILGFVVFFVATCSSIDPTYMGCAYIISVIGLWIALITIYGFSFRKMGTVGVLGIICLASMALLIFVIYLIALCYNLV